MDTRKSTLTGHHDMKLDEAMVELARSLREAAECMLDLQHAVEMLHLADHPALALDVKRQTAECLRAAMRH